MLALLSKELFTETVLVLVRNHTRKSVQFTVANRSFSGSWIRFFSSRIFSIAPTLICHQMRPRKSHLLYQFWQWLVNADTSLACLRKALTGSFPEKPLEENHWDP